MKLFLLMGSQQEFHWEDAVNSMSLIAINMMLIGFQIMLFGHRIHAARFVVSVS